MKYLYVFIFTLGACSIDSTGTALLISIALVLVGLIGLAWEGQND